MLLRAAPRRWSWRPLCSCRVSPWSPVVGAARCALPSFCRPLRATLTLSPPFQLALTLRLALALQFTMAKIKCHELRTQTQAEQLKRLDDLKQELAQLRVSKVTGGAASKLAKIKVVRKSIARVLTVYNQQQKQRLRAHDWKKYTPTDLRSKQTRAKRRELSAEQKAKLTRRASLKQRHFPQRKFAVKA